MSVSIMRVSRARGGTTDSCLRHTRGGTGKKSCPMTMIHFPLYNFTMADALTTTDLQGALPLVARGKVRDLYKVDDKTLLFVATDRISAYDVIMENVRTH